MILYPNQRVADAIVVASVWLTDTTQTLLLLHPRAPYYSVVERDNATGTTVILSTHENIVPAVESYTENGGDY